MNDAVTDETTIEIEGKLTQIRWIVFGERVKNTFLSMPDWEIPFIQNPPRLIFNKTHPIHCGNCSDVIRITIPILSRISRNCGFRW